MAKKQVPTKTRARKPAKKGKRKQAAKALQASTAAVTRTARTAENERSGYSGYSELEMDEHANPIAERPAITTIPELVRALGGVRGVNNWLRRGEETIGRWVVHGNVNGPCQLSVYLALMDLGYTRISPELFDMESWEEFRLPHMRRPAVPLEPAGTEKIRHHMLNKAKAA